MNTDDDLLAALDSMCADLGLVTLSDVLADPDRYVYEPTDHPA